MRGRLLYFCAVSGAVVLGAAAFSAGANPAEQPQDYIVVLKDSFSGSAAAVASERAGTSTGGVTYVFEHALKGFVLRMPPSVAAQLTFVDSRVAYVEADAPIRAVVTQTPATWGLDRIDQRSDTLDNSFRYSATGAGVTAYIIDTGIRFSHTQFGGRAVAGFDALGGNGTDCNGHGTHVAGTVGGAIHGVAKAVKLVSVRVLGCDSAGTVAGAIAGVDWVTKHHPAGAPAVANMSLVASASNALDNAVENSIADGITYAVAAGNGNILGMAIDACTISPARVAEALTIGATDRTDRKASWSNYGGCVDWFAPGVSITSAWSSGDDATRTISGTSMAAPHSAGAAALYLQENPRTSPSALRTALFNLTTKDVVASSNTTNNHLLYTGGDAANDPPPTPSACSNRVDDDGDGKIDYPADPGCTSSADTSEFNAPPPSPAPACSNGLDDDRDGKTDYPADPGCTSSTDTDETDSSLPIFKPPPLPKF